MKKIALFIPTLEIGGAEKVFVILSNQLRKRNILVDFLVIKKKGVLLKHLHNDINIIELSSSINNVNISLFDIMSSTIKLISYLIIKKPDILLSTLSGNNILAAVSHKISFSKSKLILRESSALKNVSSSLRIKLMRLTYSHANKIICLTHTMKAELLQSIRLKEELVSVIGNPTIDIESLQKKAFQSINNLPVQLKNKQLIVTIGRLSEPKDFITIIRAFSIAYKKNKEIGLIILGEGPLRVHLEKEIRNLKLSDKIFMPGYEDNIYKWLFRASVFILSSKWEGYPNALLEACSLGIPIVCTKYDESIEEITKNYEPKSIIPLHKPKLMSEKIIKHTQPKVSKKNYSSNTEVIVNKYMNLFFPTN